MRKRKLRNRLLHNL